MVLKSWYLHLSSFFQQSTKSQLSNITTYPALLTKQRGLPTHPQRLAFPFLLLPTEVSSREESIKSPSLWSSHAEKSRYAITRPNTYRRTQSHARPFLPRGHSTKGTTHFFLLLRAKVWTQLSIPFTRPRVTFWTLLTLTYSFFILIFTYTIAPLLS